MKDAKLLINHYLTLEHVHLMMAQDTKDRKKKQYLLGMAEGFRAARQTVTDLAQITCDVEEKFENYMVNFKVESNERE